jgi:hypothetical protein
VTEKSPEGENEATRTTPLSRSFASDSRQVALDHASALSLSPQRQLGPRRRHTLPMHLAGAIQFGPVSRLHAAPSLAAAWQIPLSAQMPCAAQ